MNYAYLLTGGNMGDRLANLAIAATFIERDIGVILKRSTVYETAAWGVEDQPDFLNQVLLVATTNGANEVLAAILAIENEMERVRTKKMGPRNIDIDILFYNTDIINLPDLIIPHPQIENRRFVLIPIAQLAPDFVHPVLNKNCSTLLKECQDKLDVKRFIKKI